METILGFSAILYEVRQLSWRPAQVNSRHFFARDSEERHRYQAVPVRPGRIHGGPVRGRSLYKGYHISIHIEKKHHPTRSEEEQTVVMICHLLMCI